MFELERKFRLRAGEYERLLADMTAQFGAPTEHQQADKLFLQGHGFDSHVRGQPIMRIRDQDGTYIFTYKRTVLDTGNRVEHETVVQDPEAIIAIMTELGWQQAVKVHKKRLEFESEMFTHALDIVDTIGAFLEIEYVRPSDDPEAEAKIFAEAERLGLDPAAQFEPKNYGLLVWEEART